MCPEGLASARARKPINPQNRTTNYLKGPRRKTLGSRAAGQSALFEIASHPGPLFRLRVQRRDHQRREHHPQTKRILNKKLIANTKLKLILN